MPKAKTKVPKTEKMRRGIPGAIEREMRVAVTEIVEKYKGSYIARKRDRLAGILFSAFNDQLWKAIAASKRNKETRDEW